MSYTASCGANFPGDVLREMLKFDPRAAEQFPLIHICISLLPMRKSFRARVSYGRFDTHRLMTSLYVRLDWMEKPLSSVST